jgi:hypothetical protein
VSIKVVAVIVEERKYKKARRCANFVGTKFKNT